MNKKEMSIHLLEQLRVSDFSAEDGLQILHDSFLAILFSAAKLSGVGRDAVHLALDEFASKGKEKWDEL